MGAFRWDPFKNLQYTRRQPKIVNKFNLQYTIVKLSELYMYNNCLNNDN